LAHVPATPVETLERAATLGRQAGLGSVYVYGDKGCDCADENAPVGDYLPGWESLHEVNQCAESCCGEEGILITRYEREAGLLPNASVK
jgi:pyruvate formate lyase activating enzyme